MKEGVQPKGIDPSIINLEDLLAAQEKIEVFISSVRDALSKINSLDLPVPFPIIDAEAVEAIRRRLDCRYLGECHLPVPRYCPGLKEMKEFLSEIQKERK